MNDLAPPTRRTVVRGAAWTIPAVAAAATAPAYAASPCTTSGCPTIAFGSVSGAGSDGVGADAAGNGWTWSLSAGGWSNRNNNPVGFRSPITTGTDAMKDKGPWFAATAEPTANNQVVTLTQTGQPALASGCSYTIKFGVVTWRSSVNPLILRTFVGSTAINDYTATTGGSASYVDQGIQSISVPANVSGVVSFRFVFGPAGDHTDIKLYSPSVVCA